MGKVTTGSHLLLHRQRIRAPGQDLVKEYRQRLNLKIGLFLGLLGLLGVLIVTAIAVGSFHIPIRDILRVLFGLEHGPQGIVIWNLRMPRIAAAIATGCGLGLSGMAIQCLLRNPLASPFTLGISQGAAFGAAFSIVLIGTGATQQGILGALEANTAFVYNIYTTTLFAFVGSITATIIILVLARLRKMSPEAIVLAGIALSSLFTSGTILIQYFATEKEIAQVVFWTFGDVSRSGWSEIIILSMTTIGAIIYFSFNRWNLNAIVAGEDTARSLGVEIQSLRLVGMFAAALVAALATAFHGVIAFLGLLAPHIAQRIVGTDYRFLIPFSCLIGSLLLLAADIAGRIMVGSGTLPVGVLTSFMGAPLFLYLLIKGLRR